MVQILLRAAARLAARVVRAGFGPPAASLANSTLSNPMSVIAGAFQGVVYRRARKTWLNASLMLQMLSLPLKQSLLPSPCPLPQGFNDMMESRGMTTRDDKCHQVTKLPDLRALAKAQFEAATDAFDSIEWSDLSRWRTRASHGLRVGRQGTRAREKQHRLLFSLLKSAGFILCAASIVLSALST